MSLGAGLSTGIGALFVCVTTSLNRTLLACTMSFSAGVMIYVSLVEVIAISDEYFSEGHSKAAAYSLATLSFFGGVAVMAVVDKCVHSVFDAVVGKAGAEAGGTLAAVSRPGSHAEEQGLCDPEGARLREDIHGDEDAAAILAVAGIEERRRLLAMAAVVSAAIVLHNIPEGMATYVASFHSISAGLPLAMAIAIHNIPEGLAVAMPVYHGTGSRVRAVLLGTLSGFAEPFGALLASFVANDRSSKGAFGGMFGLTAGMMTFVCISELLPAAYGEEGVSRRAVVGAFFGGAAVMATSLIAEKYAMPS